MVINQCLSNVFFLVSMVLILSQLFRQKVPGAADVDLVTYMAIIAAGFLLDIIFVSLLFRQDKSALC